MAEPVHPFGHEPSGVAMRHIVWAGVVTLVILVATLGGLYVLVVREVFSDRAAVIRRSGQAPTAPHLQPHPDIDLARLRVEKHAALSGYAWAGDKHAYARIPITRAMQLYAQQQADANRRGKPTTAEPRR